MAFDPQSTSLFGNGLKKLKLGKVEKYFGSCSECDHKRLFSKIAEECNQKEGGCGGIMIIEEDLGCPDLGSQEGEDELKTCAD